MERTKNCQRTWEPKWWKSINSIKVTRPAPGTCPQSPNLICKLCFRENPFCTMNHQSHHVAIWHGKMGHTYICKTKKLRAFNVAVCDWPKQCAFVPIRSEIFTHSSSSSRTIQTGVIPDWYCSTDAICQVSSVQHNEVYNPWHCGWTPWTWINEEDW